MKTTAPWRRLVATPVLIAALGGAVLAGAATAAPASHSVKPAAHATHHKRHHHATHKIGPGGDRDGDNSGAPSDGDGNF